MNLSSKEKAALIAAVMAILFMWVASVEDSGEEPPRHVVQAFEDGSQVWSDGTVTCDPAGLCAR